MTPETMSLFYLFKFATACLRYTTTKKLLPLIRQIQKIPVSSYKQVHFVYPLMTIHHCIMENDNFHNYHYQHFHQEWMSQGKELQPSIFSTQGVIHMLSIEFVYLLHVAQPYATLMAAPLPGWHNHTPHSWQYHFQGGTTIRHTHGSATSRVMQSYTTLMAAPLPGWHNHTPHSWQHHFQGGTTMRHTHGSTTSRVAQPYVTLMAVPPENLKKL